MIVKAIEKAVRETEGKKHKIAMFHYQVLIHAAELRVVDANEFCKEIRVPATYATEYRKMIRLAALMETRCRNKDGLKEFTNFKMQMINSL